MTNLEFWSEITPRDILREIYDLSASPPPPILLPDIFISVILPIRVKGEGSLAEPNKKNLLKTLAARDCCFFIREKQIVIKKTNHIFLTYYFCASVTSIYFQWASETNL